MKSIVIIGVYFGEFPENYDLWLKSCKYNKTIDFKVFTDQDIVSKLKNVEYIKFDLNHFDKLIKEKIGKGYGIEYAYKCCDYKPAYGLILEDYIKEYDFWGHCDLDMIFGDIRKYINDDILKKYDKILPLGHLSIYRNTYDVNNRFREDGSICGNYKEVFSTNKSYAFDEMDGIAKIYYKNGYSFYDKRIFADISVKHKRFTLALGDTNYNNQIFYWEKGHIYRAYITMNRVIREEFAYIHFKQRKYLKILFDSKICDSYFICNKGFISKELGIPNKEDIDKYNRYPGKLFELLESISYKINHFYKSIKRKIGE